MGLNRPFPCTSPSVCPRFTITAFAANTEATLTANNQSNSNHLCLLPTIDFPINSTKQHPRCQTPTLVWLNLAESEMQCISTASLPHARTHARARSPRPRPSQGKGKCKARRQNPGQFFWSTPPHAARHCPTLRQLERVLLPGDRTARGHAPPPPGPWPTSALELGIPSPWLDARPEV